MIAAAVAPSDALAMMIIGLALYFAHKLPAFVAHLAESKVG